ncbi:MULTISPECIES: MFS transporter [Rhodococcus]|uniref:MFS transporter n=1 Tax=Rhodococcus oxybenzonivorans TaxID=1990687 RepID=A0AAE4UX39_9NOCA|nr:MULTISPECIES: MFS transporter [Rhodococcus]MDV7243372.1 MFS transporter [Rhodococcus oxybenzonivorans]MDV7263928.1 MFS transporter [Rhodococcus oxybenzonivorans]MDV7276798.1 MFS transporter [Rhodococcus oxybenzonivorans]MDV7334368.1 MFS transporter [Rhodococcus oxybenzonivorans]MDV7344523.1 MFS transporter [Rhodococcus oxybenzonivorans]
MPYSIHTRERSARTSRILALPLLSVELLAFFFAASAPSPLFVLFQNRWSLGASTLTVIFAVYAIALLVALLTAGAVSDHIGRKPVVVAGILVQIGAMAMFVAADGVYWIIAARVVQGLATGIVTGALTAAIVEAAPPDKKHVGAMLGSISPLAGLALGALSSGLILQFSDTPVLSTFLSLAVFFAVTGVLTFFIPESATPRPGALGSLIPRVSIPPTAHTAFLASVPAIISVWMLGGLYLSLIPSTMTEILHIHAGLASGVAIAVLNGVGALAPIVLRERDSRTTTLIGACALAAGVTITLIGIGVGSVPVFFIGTAVAGVGFGSAFSGSIQHLSPLVEPHQRAEVFAALYVVSYLSFSIPAIIAGRMVAPFGLLQTELVYGAVLVAMALAALITGLVGGPARRP